MLNAKKDQKKKQEARKRINAILEKMQKHDVKGKSYKAKEWNEIHHDLLDLAKYDDQLPEPLRSNVETLAKYTEPPDPTFPHPYEELKTSLKQAANTLPGAVAGGGLSTTSVIGIVITGVVVAAGIGSYLYIQSSTTSLVLANDGCNALQVPDLSFLNVGNIEFPSGPIGDGQRGIIKMPASTVAIDTTTTTIASSGEAGRELRITAFGQTIPVPLSEDVTNVRFNNESVMGSVLTADLKQGEENAITVSCL